MSNEIEIKRHCPFVPNAVLKGIFNMDIRNKTCILTCSACKATLFFNAVEGGTVVDPLEPGVIGEAVGKCGDTGKEFVAET